MIKLNEPDTMDIVHLKRYLENYYPFAKISKRHNVGINIDFGNVYVDKFMYTPLFALYTRSVYIINLNCRTFVMDSLYVYIKNSNIDSLYFVNKNRFSKIGCFLKSTNVKNIYQKCDSLNCTLTNCTIESERYEQVRKFVYGDSESILQRKPNVYHNLYMRTLSL